MTSVRVATTQALPRRPWRTLEISATNIQAEGVVGILSALEVETQEKPAIAGDRDSS
jgi:hypothetical protein